MKGLKIRAESEEWRFREALYISKGTNRKSILGSGLIIMLFAAAVLFIIYFNADASSEAVKKAMATVGLIIILGAVAFAISIKKDSAASKIIYFGMFKDHIWVLPTNRAHKGTGYVQIAYKDITKYWFMQYSTTNNHNMSDSYHNYGELNMFVGNTKYTTQIKNIKETREWMEKLVPIKEYR